MDVYEETSIKQELLTDEESFLSQFCSKTASLYQHIDTRRNKSFECDKLLYPAII